MKRIILPIVLCLFLSCQGTQSFIEEDVSNNTINEDPSDSIVQNFQKEFMSKSTNECVPWEEIIKKPEYQELPEHLKERVRDQYFDDCLAKNLQGEDYGKEYYKFLIKALEAEKGAGFGDYLGCVSGDCKDGEGMYIWSTGSKYRGQWKDYLRNGEGRFLYSNGDKYIGRYKDDKRNGKGRYTWRLEGAKYEGQWEGGNMHGKGQYIWPDGAKYEGQWKDDKKHGEGTLSYQDGEKYTGQWEDGKRNGEGILYDKNGQIRQKGNFKNDEYIGE
ncbi:MAG: hypothetical protein FWH53_06030 [Leptospirales bacterium]|nr:hypothetical protein [Leptospirales bacterium]